MLCADDEVSDDFLRRLGDSAEPFSARMNVRAEMGSYCVGTATSFAELRQAFALRRLCFADALRRRYRSGMLDCDGWDPDSDHLLVMDRVNGLVVGNYRIRCSLFHRSFYSEREFSLGGLLADPTAVQIEVGRACVHPEYRGGLVIRLLWRGLLEYARCTGARALFGCCSVSADVPGRVETTWDELARIQRIRLQEGVRPLRPYVLRTPRTTGFRLPSLLRWYLRFGAVVLGPPAYDADFHCADFLIWLDLASNGVPCIPSKTALWDRLG